MVIPVLNSFRDEYGIPIEKSSDNRIFYTRVYEVECPDGHKASFAVNSIVENIFSQFDGEGNRHILFEDIIDHRNDGSEVNNQDAFIKTQMVTSTGVRQRRVGKFLYSGSTGA